MQTAKFMNVQRDASAATFNREHTPRVMALLANANIWLCVCVCVIILSVSCVPTPELHATLLSCTLVYQHFRDKLHNSRTVQSTLAELEKISYRMMAKIASVTMNDATSIFRRHCNDAKSQQKFNRPCDAMIACFVIRASCVEESTMCASCICRHMKSNRCELDIYL